MRAPGCLAGSFTFASLEEQICASAKTIAKAILFAKVVAIYIMTCTSLWKITCFLRPASWRLCTCNLLPGGSCSKCYGSSQLLVQIVQIVLKFLVHFLRRKSVLNLNTVNFSHNSDRCCKRFIPNTKRLAYICQHCVQFLNDLPPVVHIKDGS